MGVVSYGRGSLYFSVCLFVYLYACVSVFSLFFNFFASMDSYSPCHTGDWRYFVLMPGTAAASTAASVAAVATASPTTSMSTVKWRFFRWP